MWSYLTVEKQLCVAKQGHELRIYLVLPVVEEESDAGIVCEGAGFDSCSCFYDYHIAGDGGQGG